MSLKINVGNKGRERQKKIGIYCLKYDDIRKKGLNSDIADRDV